MTLLARKIIWSVDAFESESDVQGHVIEALRQLQKREPSLRIEPVYILFPTQYTISSDFAVPEINQYRPSAEKALEEYCRKVGLANLLPSKVISHVFSATSQAVSALTDYAVSSGASLIVAGSHGRHGFRRILLGSFAEALLLSSPVPVMIAGAGLLERKNLRPVDHILFPTDFTGNADLLFRRVVDLAVELEARITLFHSVPNPVEPVLTSGAYLLGGAWVPVHTYFSHEVERHQRRATHWARWARKQGVPTEIVVDTRAANISASIVELADREKVGLIAMDAQSGPLRASLIGSIARQVVRHASAPVWVMRSELLRRKTPTGVVPRAA